MRLLMRGLEVRRKPLQDSPTSAGNAIAAMGLERLYGYTGNTLFQERAAATLRAFAEAAPKYGIFAASYSLAALLHTRGAMEMVITGGANDSAAQKLERAAAETFRFGKSLLRITPETKDLRVACAGARGNFAASSRGCGASAGLLGNNLPGAHHSRGSAAQIAAWTSC